MELKAANSSQAKRGQAIVTSESVTPSYQHTTFPSAVVTSYFGIIGRLARVITTQL